MKSTVIYYVDCECYWVQPISKKKWHLFETKVSGGTKKELKQEVDHFLSLFKEGDKRKVTISSVRQVADLGSYKKFVAS